MDVFLSSSSLYEHAGTRAQRPAETDELRQLSAKLHCLYGIHVEPGTPALLTVTTTEGRIVDGPDGRYVTHHFLGPRPAHGDVRSTVKIPTAAFARAKVYDLRQYTRASFWGPFKNDGTQDVDWEKVEAVMVVLGHNLRSLHDRSRFDIKSAWVHEWRGCTSNSYTHSEKLGLPRELGPFGDLNDQDPYGISGMWMRVSLDCHRRLLERLLICFRLCASWVR